MPNALYLYSTMIGSNQFTAPKKNHLNGVNQEPRSYPKPGGYLDFRTVGPITYLVVTLAHMAGVIAIMKLK